jgi:DNA-binding HxlR family transcriptional regulator
MEREIINLSRYAEIPTRVEYTLTPVGDGTKRCNDTVNGVGS